MNIGKSIKERQLRVSGGLLFSKTKYILILLLRVKDISSAREGLEQTLRIFNSVEIKQASGYTLQDGLIGRRSVKDSSSITMRTTKLNVLLVLESLERQCTRQKTTFRDVYKNGKPSCLMR